MFVTGYCISQAILYFEFSLVFVANASEMSSPVSSELRGKSSIVRWPRELNALQLQKTHANRKSTNKSRKSV